MHNDAELLQLAAVGLQKHFTIITTRESLHWVQFSIIIFSSQGQYNPVFTALTNKVMDSD